MPSLDVQSMTVAEVIRAWPETLPVFQRFGIDASRGRPLLVETAAARHGLDVVEIEPALRAAARVEAIL